MRPFRRLGLILLIVLALPFAAAAQPASQREVDVPALLDTWEAEAAAVEERLAEETLAEQELEPLRRELEEQKTRIPAVLESAEAAVEPIRQQLEALGPEPEDGAAKPDTVAEERKRLEQQLAQAEALVKRIAQADARAGTLISEIMATRRALFTQQLLTRGPSVVEPGTLAQGVAALRARLAGIVAEVVERVEADVLDAGRLSAKLAPLLVLVLVLFALQALRRTTVARLTRMITPDIGQGRSIAIGIGLTVTRLVLPAASIGLVLLAVYRSELLGPQGLALLRGTAWGMSIFVGAYALSLAFFAPGASRLRLSRLDDTAAARAHWWLVALAAVVALDRALVMSGRRIGPAIEAMSLLNATLLVLGGIALWRVIGLIATAQTTAVSSSDEIAAEQEEGEEEDAESAEDRVLLPAILTAFRLLGRLSAIAAPLLAIIGYFAASRFVFFPLVFSGALVCLFLMLFYVVQAGVEGLVARWTAEGQVTERRKGRIRLIPVLVGFLLSAAAIPLLALIWGASVSDLALVWRVARAGLQIGEVRLAPADFAAFLLVFTIGFAITRLIQAVLRRSVLPLTNLDAGGRDAIRAGVGYIGVILAAVAAISFAGVDLSNLAIALGALSVGIGFGLQNVVNNFVSGIILLIERPIKTGDWVELTSGMGYVKRINVRSTEIQTFDRSSLIVPNSELISAPVVNWTHTNNNGRIIVPVGVAYGTDPRKVEKVLLEIARANPLLLRRPAPYVLFRGFGSDALQFEIRGVLRDVNWVLDAASDMNFEIARRFADEGIHIPFAQRELHLKNPEEVARALGAHFGARGNGDEQPPAIAPSERLRRASDVDKAEEDDDGSALLRLADPSAGDLVGRPAAPPEPCDAPWETLAEVEEDVVAGRSTRRPQSDRASGMEESGDGDGR